jgi:predicted phosphoadenosine phosphosulfate sulfurtransferase
MMRVYTGASVLDAAKDRIRVLFDEFEQIVVSFSGGKDSTVILNLAIEVAREKGRLPVAVVFLDQEAEWNAVIEYMRRVQARPEVDLLWLQMPFKLSNSSSTDVDFLDCWAEGAEWMREKEPASVKENRYGVVRFHALFPAISKVEFGDRSTAWITGVRAQESPSRSAGATAKATYKWITWGKIIDKDLSHYNFHPIYDWEISDVWKAIHSHGWDYCRVYDEQYRYGLPLAKMRVSNLHHETSLSSLFYLQEIERDTWNRLVKRLNGVNTAGHLAGDAYKCPQVLPFMFRSWKEYRDHLLETLIEREDHRAKFRTKFAKIDKKYRFHPDPKGLHKVQIVTILKNDYSFTLLHNYLITPQVSIWWKWLHKGRQHVNVESNRLIRLSRAQGVTPETLRLHE